MQGKPPALHWKLQRAACCPRHALRFTAAPVPSVKQLLSRLDDRQPCKALEGGEEGARQGKERRRVQGRGWRGGGCKAGEGFRDLGLAQPHTCWPRTP